MLSRKAGPNLLMTVYERQYYRHDNDETPLEIITALLHLSTKYDFKHIRRDVIAHVSKHYPMTPEAFATVLDDTAPLFGCSRYDCCFPLLKAAFTANVDVLLPILFYACTTCTLGDILEKAGFLGSECLLTLIRGKSTLNSSINSVLAMMPGDLLEMSGAWECRREEESSGCFSNGPFRVKCLENYIDTSDLVLLEGDVLIKECLEGLCPKCGEKLANLIDEHRKRIWGNVPDYFGFPDWDVLQTNLKEALTL